MRYYFELRKEKINQSGLIPIRVVVADGKTRIRKTINAKTLLDDWCHESQTIKNIIGNSYYEEYFKFNDAIAEEKKKIKRIFAFFEYNNIPFSERIFNDKYSNDEVKISISFFDAYDEYVKTSELTKARSTITKLKSAKNFYLDFVAATKFNLQLDNIDFRFEEAFMEYCFKTRETLNNYYAKLVKTLKAFMNWALERGYHNSLKFKKLKAKEEDIEVIYLSIEELMILYNHNFTNQALDRARDMYCLMSFTGQRHSDIYNLSDASVVGDFLTFTVIKTKTIQHQVYLTELAKSIIKKYEGTIYYPIPRITSQKLNKAIQICCEEIGLTEELTLTRYIGGRRIQQNFRKCDVISSHTGRKSFITNSLFLEISERIVRAQTNSKDEKSFRKYVHVSEAHLQKGLDKWNKIKTEANV